MGRKRKGASHKKAEAPEYDSDDPRAYEKENTPNRSSQDFIYDELRATQPAHCVSGLVAVNNFHAGEEKVLLEGGRRFEPAESSDEEEEVLGWGDDHDDDDDDEVDADLKKRLSQYRRQQQLEEIASDLEDEEEDDEEGEVSTKAWGKKKSIYYDTDYVDDDLPGLDQAEETAEQEAEEKEALAIQARMAQALQDEDFGLDIFKPAAKQQDKQSKEDLHAPEKVTKDLSKLSKREKLELLKKESPEFLELIADFKLKMKVLIDQLQPLVSLIQRGAVKLNPEGVQYVHTRYQLYLSYCMNISFYMILKAKHIAVTNHPVIGRILASRKLISELEATDEKLEGEIESLLSKATDAQLQPSSGEEQEDIEEEAELPVQKTTKKKKRKLEDNQSAETAPIKKKKEKMKKSNEKTVLSAEELQALEYYRSIEAAHMDKKRALSQDGLFAEEMEEEDDGKRGITYQISKNKGLTTYKRKELRNPRVKNRMKFRKAKIRRKGQVREARTELKRYSGEASGIRTGVIKSVKIK